MAKARKLPPVETRFKKGQSGNPRGRPLQDADLAALRHLTKEELKEIGNLVVKGNMEGLQAVSKDRNASVIKVMIASVAVKVISKGDMQALDMLLNRLIGKVKDEVQHTGSLSAPQVIVRLPSNGTEKKK